MVLNHLAAIVFFAGPLFYLGLWMAVDPAGIASVPAALSRFRRSRTTQPEVSRSVSVSLRIAGITLLLLAIAA